MCICVCVRLCWGYLSDTFNTYLLTRPLHQRRSFLNICKRTSCAIVRVFDLFFLPVFVWCCLARFVTSPIFVLCYSSVSSICWLYCCQFRLTALTHTHTYTLYISLVLYHWNKKKQDYREEFNLFSRSHIVSFPFICCSCVN